MAYDICCDNAFCGLFTLEYSIEKTPGFWIFSNALFKQKFFGSEVFLNV